MSYKKCNLILTCINNKIVKPEVREWRCPTIWGCWRRASGSSWSRPRSGHRRAFPSRRAGGKEQQSKLRNKVSTKTGNTFSKASLNVFLSNGVTWCGNKRKKIFVWQSIAFSSNAKFWFLKLQKITSHKIYVFKYFITTIRFLLSLSHSLSLALSHMYGHTQMYTHTCKSITIPAGCTKKASIFFVGELEISISLSFDTSCTSPLPRKFSLNLPF